MYLDLKLFADLTEEQYNLAQFNRNRICSFYLLNNVPFTYSSLISLVCSLFLLFLPSVTCINYLIHWERLTDGSGVLYLSCLQVSGIIKGKEMTTENFALLLKTFGTIFLKDLFVVFLIFVALWTWYEGNRKDFRGKLNMLSITNMMNCILETIYLIDQLAYTAPSGSAALLLTMSFSLKPCVRINMKSSL